MATTSTFDAMLKQYAPNELFREEMIKRDWFLKTFERDDTWLSGDLLVPFKGASASSIKAGSLVTDTDIAESVYVKGSITSQPEIWGALIFNEKDLMRHGKINEQNFLKLLPGEIEDFLQFMQMGVSLAFTNGPKLATATDDTNRATGIYIVNRVERFELGQKLMIDDDNSAALAVYVIAINMETDAVTFSLTRGGAAADLTAYTVAQNAVFYIDGMDVGANQLTSLKSSLLSAANGGSATLYGQTKLAYPYLQAINISGATISASNILDKLFEAQTKIRNKGKGNPDTLVMSYKHLGSILAKLEALKGAFRMADSMKASQFGWTEVEIVGVKGSLKVVAIQEMDDDYICVLDKSAIKIYSNGFFKKRVGPDGLEYFTQRATSGYKYIVDLCFFGDAVLERPSRCGIIYAISY